MQAIQFKTEWVGSRSPMSNFNFLLVSDSWTGIVEKWVLQQTLLQSFKRNAIEICQIFIYNESFCHLNKNDCNVVEIDSVVISVVKATRLSIVVCLSIICNFNVSIIYIYQLVLTIIQLPNFSSVLIDSAGCGMTTVIADREILAVVVVNVMIPANIE